MKIILLILMIPVLLSSFTTLRNSVRANESEAQTYLTLYHRNRRRRGETGKLDAGKQ